MKKVSILLTFFLLPALSFANRGVYIALEGGGGETNPGEIDTSMTIMGSTYDDANYKNSSFFTGVLGYGFDVFHVELVYANLGDTGFTLGDYLDYERNVAVAAFALRWRWRWVSFRLGLGQAIVDNNVNKNLPTGASLTHNLDEGSQTYSAAFLSVGLNIPIHRKFEMYAELNSYSWEQSDSGEVTYDDGGGNTSTNDTGKDGTQGVVGFALGARFYF